ncbi:hypothetical protein BaRGS_00002049 [Batillaria attramentaria]|uniref:BTB domain-containing protein n=1 Tax=Batillaria attramentaria TaxID=370345 RepID=A0ABD0M5B1_9CAEN
MGVLLSRLIHFGDDILSFLYSASHVQYEESDSSCGSPSSEDEDGEEVSDVTRQTAQSETKCSTYGSFETMEKMKDSVCFEDLKGGSCLKTDGEKSQSKVWDVSPVSFDIDPKIPLTPDSEMLSTIDSECMKYCNKTKALGVCQRSKDFDTSDVENAKNEMLRTAAKLLDLSEKSVQHKTPDIFSFDLNLNSDLNGKDSSIRSGSKYVMDDVFIPDMLLVELGYKDATGAILQTRKHDECTAYNVSAVEHTSDSEVSLDRKNTRDIMTVAVKQRDENPPASVESRDWCACCSPEPLDLHEAMLNDLNLLERASERLVLADSCGVNILTVPRSLSPLLEVPEPDTPERLVVVKQSTSSTCSSNAASDVFDEDRTGACERTGSYPLSASERHCCADGACATLKEMNTQLLSLIDKVVNSGCSPIVKRQTADKPEQADAESHDEASSELFTQKMCSPVASPGTRLNTSSQRMCSPVASPDTRLNTSSQRMCSPVASPDTRLNTSSQRMCSPVASPDTRVNTSFSKSSQTPPSSADVGQHEATSSTSKSDAAPSSASRPVRRRVTFSEEKAGDEVLPQLACKPPPILFRQHSTESSCSTSSGESVLAFALDPESPTLSEASSPFDFPSGLHGNCFAFPRDGTDLVLMAEGVKFHVHRSFLLSVCPMLRAHLRETSACQVLLHDKRAGDVLDFLRLLYPGQSQVVNDRNLEGILDLAFQFGADSVQRICITYLQGLAEFRHLCSHQPPVPDLHHRGPNHHNDRSDATTITLKPFGARSQRAPAYTAEHQYSKSSSYDHEETVGSAFSSPETAEDRFIDSGRSRNALEARTGLHSNRSGAGFLTPFDFYRCQNVRCGFYT